MSFFCRPVSGSSGCGTLHSGFGRGNGTFRRLPQTLIPPSSDTMETSYGCVYEET